METELPPGVRLIRSDTFWPEGQWYFIRDLAVPLVWGRASGWRKYYEADKADSHFKTAKEAMEAWKKWTESNQTAS